MLKMFYELTNLYIQRCVFQFKRMLQEVGDKMTTISLREYFQKTMKKSPIDFFFDMGTL